MSEIMYGIEIIDAALLPALLVAFVAGGMSFLSPCVLPIVPPYLAYMSGVTLNEMDSDATGRRRAVVAALFFVMGLSTVFLLLGFTASAFGAFFLQNQALFSKISGVVVIIFGLHFLNVFRIPFLDQEARPDVGRPWRIVLWRLCAGGWPLPLAGTPCIGPSMGRDPVAGRPPEASVARGTVLLGVYAAGLGIPFLLAAMFITRAMGLMNRIKRHMALIERIMGVLLVVVGLALVTGAFTWFSFWLLETFPVLSTLG